MVTHSVITDRGERGINEDYTGVIETPERSVFLLADGLGGHGNGDYASRFVVEHMKELLMDNPFADVGECIQDSQNKLLGEQRRLRAEKSMKTTITALDIRGSGAQFYHVGDSRIYYFHKKKYKLRSSDHSVPQALYMSGRIREKDIRHHEDRSRLLKVMGMEWRGSEYDASQTLHIGKKDAFLLCSDGFWELIEEKQMEKFLKKSSTPEEWLRQMQVEILQNGTGKNMDNYSGIAVMIS